MQSSVNVNATIENKMLTLLLRDTDVQIIKLYVNLRFALKSLIWMSDFGYDVNCNYF